MTPNGVSANSSVFIQQKRCSGITKIGMGLMYFSIWSFWGEISGASPVIPLKTLTGAKASFPFANLFFEILTNLIFILNDIPLIAVLPIIIVLICGENKFEWKPIFFVSPFPVFYFVKN